MDKSKCYDIFQRTRVNDMRMYSQERTIKDIISYSMDMKNKERMIKNIQLLKKLCPNILNGYNNLAFITLTLREIKLAKQIFVHNVELGDEAYIPCQLNQKDLSLCYTFYNPILSIVQDLCSDHKKNLYIERNTQLLRMAQGDMQLTKRVLKRVV